MFKVGHLFKNPSRQQIDQTTQGKKSDYSQQVSVVNQVLDQNGITISDRSKASVIDNIKKVETGERSEVTAHGREAVTFARDSFESAKKGEYKQASVELTGAVLNSAGIAYKAVITPTPGENRGNTPW
ncbi:hypothetical protein LZ198_13060 [Myxococcus sp. K15C18031901]|uniref:hypothetical protein n=1 Tax=Myxococcus dinghuensis TaxID=2906761 RepID=UPI0020A7B5A4|nr:hypothetical protein [Myxococcus dinghuensis]MCP3099797.1 hypothetical protein [Myxococcus dinghuensis]